MSEVVNLPLSVLDPQTLPPAVFTGKKAPHLSKVYKHLDSREVVKTLAEEGFYVASCKAVRRKDKKADPLYAAHQIEFRRKADIGSLKEAEFVPRWLFTNSHDGTTSVQLMGGVFRVICSNGMIRWDEEYGHIRCRHSSASIPEVVTRLKTMASGDAAKKTLAEIEVMQKARISPTLQLEFARLASIARWGTDQRYAAEALLAPRREADAGDSAWLMMNRVQEHIMIGGVDGKNAGGRPARSVGVHDFGKESRINQQLWRLAIEFAGYSQ